MRPRPRPCDRTPRPTIAAAPPEVAAAMAATCSGRPTTRHSPGWLLAATPIPSGRSGPRFPSSPRGRGNGRGNRRPRVPFRVRPPVAPGHGCRWAPLPNDRGEWRECPPPCRSSVRSSARPPTARRALWGRRPARFRSTNPPLQRPARFESPDRAGCAAAACPPPPAESGRRIGRGNERRSRAPRPAGPDRR